MIVQTAAEGQPHFVMTMAQHTAFCGQLARAFGNADFEAPQPFEEVLYVVENHDRGWDDYDARPGLDPETRLPYSLVRTPVAVSLHTNYGSPAFNEQRHPYCGLLSSMHSWGLHNKRYGFSQYVVRQRTTTSIVVPEQFQRLKADMLAREVERQQALRARLAADPATAGWVQDAHLFQNYKQLQFFDTLALYFHLHHAGERGEEVYIHVPAASDRDETVTVTRRSDLTYALDPFPFRDRRLELVCEGRYMMPLAAGSADDDLADVLAAAPQASQHYELVPA